MIAVTTIIMIAVSSTTYVMSVMTIMIVISVMIIIMVMILIININAYDDEKINHYDVDHNGNENDDKSIKMVIMIFTMIMNIMMEAIPICKCRMFKEL